VNVSTHDKSHCVDRSGTYCGVDHRTDCLADSVNVTALVDHELHDRAIAAKRSKVQRSSCVAFSGFDIGTRSDQGVDGVRMVVGGSNMKLFMVSGCSW
jgi:hypothetical protein